jgi:hypothetical protein
LPFGRQRTLSVRSRPPPPAPPCLPPLPAPGRTRPAGGGRRVGGPLSPLLNTLHSWKAGHDRRRLVELAGRSGALIGLLLPLALALQAPGVVASGLIFGALAVELTLAHRRRISLDTLAREVDRADGGEGLFTTALAVARAEAVGDPGLQAYVAASALRRAPQTIGASLHPVTFPRAYGGALLVGLALLTLLTLRGHGEPPPDQSSALSDGAPAAPLDPAEPREEPAAPVADAPRRSTERPAEAEPTDAASGPLAAALNQLWEALGAGLNGGEAARSGSPSPDRLAAAEAPAAEAEQPQFGQGVNARRGAHGEEGPKGAGPGLAASAPPSSETVAREPSAPTAKAPEIGAADPKGATTTPGELPPEAEKASEETRAGEADEAATAKDGGEAMAPPGGETKTGLTSKAPVTAGTPSDANEAGGEGPPGAGGVNDQSGTTDPLGQEDTRARRRFVEEQLRSQWRRSPEGLLRELEAGQTGGAASQGYSALFDQYSAIAEGEAAEGDLPEGRRALLGRYFDTIGPAPAAEGAAAQP